MRDEQEEFEKMFLLNVKEGVLKYDASNESELLSIMETAHEMISEKSDGIYDCPITQQLFIEWQNGYRFE